MPYVTNIYTPSQTPLMCSLPPPQCTHTEFSFSFKNLLNASAPLPFVISYDYLSGESTISVSGPLDFETTDRSSIDWMFPSAVRSRLVEIGSVWGSRSFISRWFFKLFRHLARNGMKFEILSISSFDGLTTANLASLLIFISWASSTTTECQTFPVMLTLKETLQGIIW